MLYMPTTLPGISVDRGAAAAPVQDAILKQFPEVERVFGKAGRAETSTDPAPFSMMETIDRAEAARRSGASVDTWYSDWAPEWLKPVLRRISPRPHLARRAGRAR